MRSGDRGVLTFAVGAIVVIVVALTVSGQAPQSIGVLFSVHVGLLVGMSAGLFGAAFSMLTQSQRRASQGTLEDIGAGADWHTLLIRGAFGVGGATIVYFFFDSGLLEGTLWPKLNELGFNPVTNNETLKVPNRHLCLLVIWCFIAGFSETFVPNILVNTEARTNRS